MGRFPSPFGWYEGASDIYSTGWCVLHIEGSDMLIDARAAPHPLENLQRVIREQADTDICMRVSEEYNCRVRCELMLFLATM